MSQMQKLLGYRILVAGASADSAIGLSICQELASNGARLVLIGRRRALLEQTRNSIENSESHTTEVLNLANLDTIAERVKVISETGTLNGLVYSASFQGYSSLARINAKQFDQYFHVNVAAPLMMAKGLRQKGVCPDGASIVMIGSVAGLRGQKGRSLYASSKAALVSLTQSLSLELADKSIRVNGIAPAVIRSPKADEQFKLLNEEQRKSLFEAHPMGLGSPIDIAKATVFLLSVDSAWITGTTLAVDGGYLAG